MTFRRADIILYKYAKCWTRGIKQLESSDLALARQSGWLETFKHHTVALKVFTNDLQNREDTLTLQGPKGEHQCLVHNPMWESTRDLLRRNESRRLTEDLLKALLLRLFKALDYLHTEAHLIHTDISTSNILMEIEDQSIITAFIKAEQERPSPRKIVDGYTVYVSRGFDLPKSIGEPVLSDFGSTVSGEVEHDEDVHPPWSYGIDIWNVKVLIWDLFEGKHMLYGQDT